MMSPTPTPSGFHTSNMNMQPQTAGWNQVSGSLSAKPATGWLHPDESIMGDGVRFHVNYVGCVVIKESMRHLGFDKRTLLAREAICQVVHFTHYKHLQNWTPNQQLEQTDLSRMIDTRYSSPGAGSRVLLTISTDAITLVAVDNQKPILRHEMCSISFASGGEGETSEFIGYVAKDSDNQRACHVVEVPSLAPDVIATIGQAFELRYKQHIQAGGGDRFGNNAAMIRGNAPFISPDSKWGEETASQCSSQMGIMASNRNGAPLNELNRQSFNGALPNESLLHAQNPRLPGAATNNLMDFMDDPNRRNSQYLQNNIRPGFEDNFVPTSAYLNMNMGVQQNSPNMPPNMNPIKQPINVRTEFPQSNSELLANMRNTTSSSNNNSRLINGSPMMVTSPSPRPMHTFYQQQANPMNAPRKMHPASFSENPQAATSLAQIMVQSKHAQNAGGPPDSNAPRIPERKSPKPNEMRLTQSGVTEIPPTNKPPGAVIPRPTPPSGANQPANRASVASNDENLVAIPQTESVMPLQQQVWFHGPISRNESEKRLRKDGDFLVREKVSASNDTIQYVLSGYQSGVVKHLLLVDPHGRVRTKHNIFENVSHLITHHMKNNIPIISSDSQVRLGNPVKKPLPSRPGMHTTDI